MLQPVVEKITARIAVSELARKVQVEHIGGGAVEIPNGVAVAKFATAEPLTGWPGEGGTLGFLGRFTESRKGFELLRTAFVTLARQRPELRLLVAGPGDRADLYEDIPADLHPRVEFLGLVSEADKARMLRSVDVYVAPNTGGESFGMILTEAMAAGAPIVASDLDAFRRVLAGGSAGALFPVGDAEALTRTLDALLDDAARRSALTECAHEVVRAFDWPSVANRVLEVYATAIEATDGRVFDADWVEPRSGP
jgi:phosphatidylinositol alpha-mannosyltransferase